MGIKKNIKEIFGNEGFKRLVIGLAIILAAVIIIQLFITSYFMKTEYFKENLDIPAEFYIGSTNLRTIALNAALFGIIVFMILSYNKIKEIPSFRFKGHQIVFLAASLFFLVFQFIYKYIINHNIGYFINAPILWGIVKVAINASFFITLTIGVLGLDLIGHLFRSYKREITIFLASSSIFFLLMLLVQNLWTYFSAAISKILYIFFSLFFEKVTYKPFVASFTMAEGGGPLLGINNFRAIIGKPCSGIDSFLLFTSLYALIVILDYKRVKKGLAIALYFVGALGMFLTNLIRILLLYIVGAFWNADFAIGMFHSNIGWILFIVYFFVFWTIASRFIYRKGMQKEENKDRERTEKR